MQKLFAKALSFIIGITIVFNLLGTFADRVAPLDDWRTEQQDKIANLQAKGERIEAITLGNSHSDAIDYSVLGIEGQSLAFAAADLFEIEKYAVYLVKKLPQLKTVFIAISYYSFSRDNATYEPFRTRRIRFYSLVPTWSPIQKDLPNFLLGKLEAGTHILSIVRSDSWQGVWTGLANDTLISDPFPYDGVHTNSGWGECFHYTEEQLETHAREIAERNMSSSAQMAVLHPGLEQDAFDALVRTIKLLHSRGIRVILFTPTYYQEYNTHFEARGSRIIEDMRQAIQMLRQSYEVTYYDFSRNPEITLHPELFYNSDHLSECGRKLFTEKLLAAMIAHNERDK